MTPDDVADALVEHLFDNPSGDLDAALPARDLWAGVEARIAPRVVPIAERAAAGSRAPLVNGRWLPRAAAAALLVSATAGLTYLATVRYADRPGSPARSVATAEQVPSATRVPVRQPPGEAAPGVDADAADDGRAAAAVPGAASPTRSNAHLAAASRARESLVPGGTDTLYDREIALLRAAVAERRGQLDPATVAVVERNLKVIDAAIAQSRAALRKDPVSAFLGEQLTRALASKVGLLRTAALLPSST